MILQLLHRGRFLRSSRLRNFTSRSTVQAMSAAASPLTQQCTHNIPAGNIAYRVTRPQKQADIDVIFLHGLCSDMTGTKARELELHAQRQGHGFLCFDARGHGSSSGTFEGTNLADWYEDAEKALQLAPGHRHILVGSSFGGWQALCLASDHPEEVAGIILIAPALDFTARFWNTLTLEQRAAAQQQGQVALGSKYMEDGQIMVNMKFFEAAEKFLVLDRLQQLHVRCPVRILHGVQDDVVPVSIAQQLFDQLPVSDMALTMVKDGDHRLSRPHDIRLLLSTVDDMMHHICEK